MITDKDKAVIDIAKKKGNDADLLLLDKIYELQDELHQKEPSIPNFISVQKQADGMLAAAEQLLKHVETIRQQNDAEFAQIHQYLETFRGQLLMDTSSKMNEVRKEITYSSSLAVEKMLEEGAATIEQKVKKIVPKNGRDGKDGKDGKNGKTVVASNKAAIENLLADIKRLETRVGWGAHPLTIQQDGVTKAKVARYLNFVGATVTVSPSGVVTITCTGGGTGTTTSELILQDGTDVLLQDGGVILLHS